MLMLCGQEEGKTEMQREHREMVSECRRLGLKGRHRGRVNRMRQTQVRLFQQASPFGNDVHHGRRKTRYETIANGAMSWSI